MSIGHGKAVEQYTRPHIGASLVAFTDTDARDGEDSSVYRCLHRSSAGTRQICRSTGSLERSRLMAVDEASWIALDARPRETLRAALRRTLRDAIRAGALRGECGCRRPVSSPVTSASREASSATPRGGLKPRAFSSSSNARHRSFLPSVLRGSADGRQEPRTPQSRARSICCGSGHAGGRSRRHNRRCGATDLVTFPRRYPAGR